jgi:hypothetical protein
MLTGRVQVAGFEIREEVRPEIGRREPVFTLYEDGEYLDWYPTFEDAEWSARYLAAKYGHPLPLAEAAR